MKFVKAVWKLLVGIKDALVLIFMLLFFGLLYAGLSSRPAAIEAGVLALDLDGAVVEQPSRAGFADIAGGSRTPREYRLRDLIGALDAARTDDRVKAVALDLGNFIGGGQTAMSDLADAVRRLRSSGKPVVAYAVAYSDDSYLVASAASEVWMDPLGAVAIAGPGGSNLYFKGLLDKLGVTANVYRVGTYKAAVEPYTRSDMSPAAKENAQALAGALLESWREAVARNRPKAKVEPYMMNPVGALAAGGGDLSRAAIEFGLVDKIGSREQFEARMAQLGGKDSGSPTGYKAIKLDNYVDDAVPTNSDGTIGVITVAGMIVDGQASPGTAGGDSIAELIDKAVQKNSLKALVVRVDSPGGSVLASERIRQSILNAKRHKLPVVVSMGSVAASGGYWVSTPGDFIYAEPSTITGSIGVFGILPSFQGTLKKLGIGADGIQTTPLSGQPDLLAGPSPVANQMLQAGVDSIYRHFLGIVAQSRHKQPVEVDRIAQGRVWDGGTARQLGLVDGFGGLSDAIEKAGALAKISNPQDQVRYLERPPSFEDQLVAMLARDSSTEGQDQDAFSAIAPESRITDAMAELRSVLSSPRIQARCLDCPPVAPARVSKQDVGFWAAVRAWLL
ncbi:signal peptide peptidase SppA [Sphingomonas sp. RG327]|uniref:Signal peptide peptidase SppA n=1 Tax=Sphingomonas anseongensis TaxID=2908207 RepID=A0ABT0REX5_9SPHN|nr:signal peptide peptidase SppA [Sphingomonas anseongensis]MCL6678814.1 signal peptide peptidase SppA [Sphingomonas anseongensis]